MSKNESFGQKDQKTWKIMISKFRFRTNFSSRVHTVFLVKGSLPDAV